MGAWVTLIEEYPNLDEKIERFRSVFSVQGVPELHVECVEHESQKAVTIIWGWGKGGLSDLQVVKEGNSTLVLHGIITGMGRFGESQQNQRDVALQILKLWKNHGQDVISELNGSFSCLFYDKAKDNLNIFVDRFASKPIWFTEEKRGIIVGNFPSAVAVLKSGSLKLNPAGLWSLFHTSRHVGNQGIYDGLLCLMAGQKLSREKGGLVKTDHWWHRKFNPREGVSLREWGELIAKVLRGSASRYRRTCTNPYLFLSGGLDSRIVAAAIGKPMHTVSLCTMPNAETRIASAVARVLDIKHSRIVRSPHWYLETLEAAALVSSGNYFTHHTHFIVPASEIARQEENAQFFLGDLLENFNKHYFSAPEMSVPKFDSESMDKFLLNCVPYTLKDTQRIGLYFRPDYKCRLQEMYKDALRKYAKSVVNVSEDDADRFDTLLRWANVGITPTYNMLTCFHPIAGERNIRFDNHLDDLFSTIPSHVKAAGKLHAWILFSLNKWLPIIPNANTFLPPIMPESLGKFTKKVRPFLGRLRRKRISSSTGKPILNTSGSWLLLHEMYRKDPEYRAAIEKILTDSDAFPDEIFDRQEINKTWEEFIAGNIGLSYEINALISFGTLHSLIPSDGISI